MDVDRLSGVSLCDVYLQLAHAVGHQRQRARIDVGLDIEGVILRIGVLVQRGRQRIDRSGRRDVHGGDRAHSAPVLGPAADIDNERPRR